MSDPAVLPAVTAAAVISTVAGAHTAAGFVMITVGCALIVILVVVVLLHVPFVNVYVTVYVPGVLVFRSISPVAALITTPAGAV